MKTTSLLAVHANDDKRCHIDIRVCSAGSSTSLIIAKLYQPVNAIAVQRSLTTRALWYDPFFTGTFLWMVSNFSVFILIAHIFFKLPRRSHTTASSAVWLKSAVSTQMRPCFGLIFRTAQRLSLCHHFSQLDYSLIYGHQMLLCTRLWKLRQWMQIWSPGWTAFILRRLLHLLIYTLLRIWASEWVRISSQLLLTPSRPIYNIRIKLGHPERNCIR